MTDTSLQANNPLLDFSGLPRFADIRPEHITPAIDVLLERAAQGAPSGRVVWTRAQTAGRGRRGRARALRGPQCAAQPNVQ